LQSNELFTFLFLNRTASAILTDVLCLATFACNQFVDVVDMEESRLKQEHIMGKRRRAAKKVVKKKRATVAKVFKCLFCNIDDSVHCAIDIRSMTGKLECSVCEAKFQTQINTLTEPIDIFTEWLDETADMQAAEAKNILSKNTSRQSREDNAPAGDDY
jgi:transcription elongation factor Elf1